MPLLQTFGTIAKGEGKMIVKNWILGEETNDINAT